MEDAISGVQTGAIKSVQLIEAQDKLKFNDHSFIQVCGVLAMLWE